MTDFFGDTEEKEEKKPYTLEELYKFAGLRIGSKLYDIRDRYRLTDVVRERVLAPCIKKTIKDERFVVLSFDELAYLIDFARRKTKAKFKEWAEKDAHNRITRDLTGAKGEYGSLKYYDREQYFNDKITENSSETNYPDWMEAGVPLGTKTSLKIHMPMVFKSKRTYNFRGNPEQKYKCCDIICIVDGTMIESPLVYLLGLATPAILEEYVDDNLILQADVPSKTGFWGMEHLLPLPKTFEELQAVCSSNIVAV